jgi:hypothetical protein
MEEKKRYVVITIDVQVPQYYCARCGATATAIPVQISDGLLNAPLPRSEMLAPFIATGTRPPAGWDAIKSGTWWTLCGRCTKAAVDAMEEVIRGGR